MLQDLSKVYLHISFSTLDCQNMINEAMRESLEPCTVEALQSVGAETEKMYVHTDHLHVLCTMPVHMSPDELVAGIKKSTSRWINKHCEHHFAWQEGYAAFSVSPLKVGAVCKFLRNQPHHHKNMTWKEEMRIFYEYYDIQYDETLVWR